MRLLTWKVGIESLRRFTRDEPFYRFKYFPVRLSKSTLFLKRSCKDFFKRIEGMEITGFVDEFVFNGVFHKLMVTAIVNRYRISPQEAVTSMKNNPGILKELPELWQACELLKTIEVKIVPGPFFPDFLVVAQEYQLLATDAIHVAAMNKAGINHIVSNDTDFSRVQSLRVWRPDKTEAPA